MIRLEKFYDLISRNATVTLTNRQLDTTFFEGSMRDIPDHFSNCIVEDFCVSNTGDFLFKIKVNPVPANEEKRLWHEGSLRVHGSIFHYWFKQYDEGSEFGIDGGRISKLQLRQGLGCSAGRRRHSICLRNIGTYRKLLNHGKVNTLGT